MIFGVVAKPLEWERWDEAAALLGEEVGSLLAPLNDGLATLWVAIDGTIKCALVTQLIDADGGRECFLRLVAGQCRDDWLPFLDGEIATWARQQGCTAMELNGRPGWERVFRDWKKVSVVLRREL